MAIAISSRLPEHDAAVSEFNARARLHDAPFLLSGSHLAGWLPQIEDGRSLFCEFFVASEGGVVRGGYTLRRQMFRLNDEIIQVANYQGPLSEGLWDRRYMMTGVQMLRAALRDQPLLYALGMGDRGQPLPKLLVSSGWSMVDVPFRFKVFRAAEFLRNIRPLRRTSTRRMALDFASVSGIGPLGVHALQWWRFHHRSSRDIKCIRVSEFGNWADEVWETAGCEFAFSAVRDRPSQNILFGDGNEKNHILRCTGDGRDIGWAVVRSTQMHEHKYFGDLKVGSLVDCFSVPGSEVDVVSLATTYLRLLGSGVVVTNQSHHRWLGALDANGWLRGPSNFLFAASPRLVECLGPLEKVVSSIHFNRADGDGPIHL